MPLHTNQIQQRLTSLIDATQQLIGMTEPEELLQHLLESALRLFAADACSLALIDEAEQQLAFAMTLGGARMEEFRLPLGQGIVGWVAEKGEGVIAND
ncbi:MAG: GAF domain-containing protein, partial [Deltaproteobacteria bacterium]|nr:GAF domain-containing protein [Deltaproteobacteria bacterium]